MTTVCVKWNYSYKPEYLNASIRDWALYCSLYESKRIFLCVFLPLTLYLLTWRIWWAPNNDIKWQMGFNSVFKGLIYIAKLGFHAFFLRILAILWSYILLLYLVLLIILTSCSLYQHLRLYSWPLWSRFNAIFLLPENWNHVSIYIHRDKDLHLLPSCLCYPL
jgi:hypothetical protein